MKINKQETGVGPLKTYQIVTKQEIPGHSIKGGDL